MGFLAQKNSAYGRQWVNSMAMEIGQSLCPVGLCNSTDNNQASFVITFVIYINFLDILMEVRTKLNLATASFGSFGSILEGCLLQMHDKFLRLAAVTSLLTTQKDTGPHPFSHQVTFRYNAICNFIKPVLPKFAMISALVLHPHLPSFDTGAHALLLSVAFSFLHCQPSASLLLPSEEFCLSKSISNLFHFLSISTL